jgi:hypothetical protein
MHYFMKITGSELLLAGCACRGLAASGHVQRPTCIYYRSS